MGLLDPLFAQVLSGFGVQQEDPQGAMLSEFLRLPQQQPAQAQAPALPTGHVMPQAQAQAPPAPNFLDRLSAMSRGYGEGGLVGGIADAFNLGDSRGERAQAQQRNQAVDYLIANGIDPQTAQMAPNNPELMKSLFGSVVSKRYGDKGEEFKEVDGVGYGIRRGPDGNLMQRRLDGGEGAPAPLMPGTIAGAPKYKDPKAVADVVGKLRGDFEGAPAFKTHATTADAYRKMEKALGAESAAGDVSGIYAFMKMLDPNSVVRETEFATAQNAAGVPDQIRNLYNRVMSGERLNPEQRADFINQGRSVYQNSERFFKKHQDNYRGISERLFIDPRGVVYDLENAEQSESPGAPPSATAAPRSVGGSVVTGVPKGPDPKPQPGNGWSVQRVR
jgi:hypothetical protein